LWGRGNSFETTFKLRQCKIKKFDIVLLCFFLSAFMRKERLFFVPENFAQPLYDFSKNTIKNNKILLGRTLFYDPILLKNNLISCESCHSPFSPFSHIDLKLSHGIYDSIGKRNSAAIVNLASQKTFMWDGAINN